MTQAPRRPPLVVTGMHRSGGSLVAALLAAAGLHSLEDTELALLNRRMSRAAVPADDGGCPDWGWTESEAFDRARLSPFRPEAQALYARRSASGVAWGWQDPGTTPWLELWDEISAREARFLLLYRAPWEVADSLQRLGVEAFLDRPGDADRVWCWYNRALLDFHARTPERSLLVCTDALIREPSALTPLLAERLGVFLDPGAPCPFERERFTTLAPDDPLIRLRALASPGAMAMLAELEQAAELSGRGLWRFTGETVDRASLPADAAVDVSVVLPCFDMGDLLLEAIASVERTVSNPYEIVIVNDGSSEPRTLEVMATLEAAGYRVIDQPNRGVSAARNAGAAAARGRYLLFLDADNRLRPGFVAAAVEVFEADAAAGLGVVYGPRWEFGQRAGLVEVREFDLDAMLRANFIDTCALIRREVWLHCGGFDVALESWEDWDLWLGAVEHGFGFHRLAVTTFDYRVRPRSKSSRLLAAERGVPARLYLLDKHRELYRSRLPFLLTAAHEASEAAAAGDAARAEVQRLAARCDALSAELALLALREPEPPATVADDRDREALDREIAAFRRRVEGMERTRAWRLRGWILRMRELFGL